MSRIFNGKSLHDKIGFEGKMVIKVIKYDIKLRQLFRFKF